METTMDPIQEGNSADETYDGYYNYDYGSDNPAVQTLGTVSYYLNYVFLILGTPGNLLSFFVLVMSYRRRKSTMYLYLVAVSICDTLFLCLNSLMAIGSESSPHIYFDWLTHCRLFGPVLYIVSELSGLLIMMVTVNRFLAVFLPFKAKEWQTKKITCIIIISLVLMVLALNWFWFGGITRVKESELSETHFWDHCQGRTPLISSYYLKVFPWVDLCIYLLVPSCVMLVLNPGILIKLHFESKKGLLSMKTRGGGGETTAGHTKRSFINKSVSSVHSTSEPKNEKESGVEVKPKGITAKDQEPNNPSPSKETDNADTLPGTSQDTNVGNKEVQISIISTPDKSDTTTDKAVTRPNSSQNVLRKWSLKRKEQKVKKAPKPSVSNQKVHLTVICLVLSCSFLVFVAPIFTSNLLTLVNMSLGGGPYLSPVAEEALREVGVVLLNVNHSINFLLYCITSQAFRKDLKEMLCKRK